MCLVSQLCLTLCDPIDCTPPGSSIHEDSPGKNIRVGCHTLLQGIFPTQESNWGLLHCRLILYQLNYEGSQKLSGQCLLKTLYSGNETPSEHIGNIFP